MRGDSAPWEKPQRYKVQFTATQEYVDLLEEARDLLAHAVPRRSLEEVHLRALRALVTQLKKRKYAVTSKRVSKDSAKTSCDAAHGHADAERCDAPEGVHADGEPPETPRRRGRNIPADVRRAVWERDGGRCTYVDATGQRCRETGCLEFDHIDPCARGGPHTVENLRLRCPPHNALAAEQIFGRDFMERMKGTSTNGMTFEPSERDPR